ALDVVDDVRGALIRLHLHQHVAGIKALGHRHTFAVLDFDDVLRRNDRFLNPLLFRRLAFFFGDLVLDELLDLVLVAGIRLDRVPARLVDSTHYVNRPMMKFRMPRTDISISQMMSATMITKMMIT